MEMMIAITVEGIDMFDDILEGYQEPGTEDEEQTSPEHDEGFGLSLDADDNWDTDDDWNAGESWSTSDRDEVWRT